MIGTRRWAMLSLAALAGCAAAPARVVRGPEPAMPAVPNPGWDAWVAGYRARALSRGIPAATVESAFRGAGFLPGVIDRDRNQAETARSLEDYLALTAGEDRVTEGRAALARHGTTLAAIERRFGVEAAVVCAVWGVESRYGTRRGDIPVISALSTLAYDGRRGAFFESQLDAALRILANGDIGPDRMTGSWAGAMGHTQFIPTSYIAYAVDFTGDGRRDIWGEDPTDALASTAAYLAEAGWRPGLRWGVEVTAPEGAGGSRATADWAALGVRPAAGGALPDLGTATLIRPADPGPAFLVSRNYTVIGRYNNAESYKISVGYLSDRLRGAGPLRARFGPDASGLTQADRIRLQQRLTARGFDTGGSDGVIGARTTEAIRAFQAASGLPVTGLPSPALLARLG